MLLLGFREPVGAVAAGGDRGGIAAGAQGMVQQRCRNQKRAEMAAMEKHRRIEIGPYCTFYFESYETMWEQVHEMLAIEKGGEEQVPDELQAYNPLIPQGRELTATVMFEIDDEVRRKQVLNKLGGVEETMFVEVNGERIMSRAEEDADRLLRRVVSQQALARCNLARLQHGLAADPAGEDVLAGLPSRLADRRGNGAAVGEGRG